MKGISNRVAVVTGAGSGIGRATCFRFAQEGATVIAADVDVEGGTKTAELARQEGEEAHFIETDVSDSGDVKLMFDEVVEKYGKLNFVFNNAGIEGRRRLSTEQEESTWENVVNVNMKGVWLGIKYAIPHLLETDGSGAIVNTASTAGITGASQLTPYSASKHGVVGITRSAAKEFGKDGIRVNAVCPGPVDTPMVQRYIGDDEEDADTLAEDVPLKRAADPSELAGAVVWLFSEDASYVNGHPLLVDGGQLA
jgi:NAD(P)-dependent dehydrogenase (short-subunit alcohol dehydrogenase family)